MNCFECAKAHDSVSAVGICQHCGAGLCVDHMVEAHEFHVGGTIYSCRHEFPNGTPLRGVPAGVAAGRRHQDMSGRH
jgi:hypothetical protein